MNTLHDSVESLTEPDDADLIALVRAGDVRAQEILYTRHYRAAQGTAYRHSNSAFEVEDLVAEGFEKVFAILRTGGGPEVFFRAYLCRAISNLAFAYNTKEKRLSLTDEFAMFDQANEHADPVMSQFESGIVVDAFRSLPERWQAVLWYLEVDDMKPADVAPLLGLAPNGVSALAVRAREGLRQAYLQCHIQKSPEKTCKFTSTHLGTYIRGKLTPRNEAKVDQHLSECSKCTAALLQLDEVNSAMRGVIAPLFLGGITALGLPAAITAASIPTTITTAYSGKTAAGLSIAKSPTVVGKVSGFIGLHSTLAIAVGSAAALALAATLAIAAGSNSGAASPNASLQPSGGAVDQPTTLPDAAEQTEATETTAPVIVDERPAIPEMDVVAVSPSPERLPGLVVPEGNVGTIPEASEAGQPSAPALEISPDPAPEASSGEGTPAPEPTPSVYVPEESQP
ncbi:sigma-70 family RNA polymerase sigma factor, partial [Paeniglutamicibacter sp. NPDC091659]|uniref:sigma-70 family RNA polymerase sigma factor n=1 Tax=Paeniglutamicibacter sp. NPDC091659 TaxID=3364389 RepID=UPI00380D6CDC